MNEDPKKLFRLCIQNSNSSLPVLLNNYKYPVQQSKTLLKALNLAIKMIIAKLSKLTQTLCCKKAIIIRDIFVHEDSNFAVIYLYIYYSKVFMYIRTYIRVPNPLYIALTQFLYSTLKYTLCSFQLDGRRT